MSKSEDLDNNEEFDIQRWNKWWQQQNWHRQHKKCNNTGDDDDDDDDSKSEEMHLTCVGDFLTFCEFKLCFKV